MYRLNNKVLAPMYDALASYIGRKNIIDDGDLLLVKNVWKDGDYFYVDGKELLCSKTDIAKIVIEYDPEWYPNQQDKEFIKECEEYLQEISNKI